MCVRDTRRPGSLPRVADVGGSFHTVLGRYGEEKGNAGTGAEKGGVGPEVTGGASRGTRFGPGGLVWKGDYNHRVTKKIKHEAKIETYDTGGVRALRFRTRRRSTSLV